MRSYTFETLSDVGTLGFGDDVIILAGDHRSRERNIERAAQRRVPQPGEPTAHDLTRIEAAKRKRARKAAKLAQSGAA